MIVALALVLAAAFGAGDQYLGSMSWDPWAADLSLLSAPWLLLAFLAGWTQREPRRAALLGLACTACALLGYGLMTLSPVENAHLTVRTGLGFLSSERPVLAGGLATGPLFGYLGHRRRIARAWRGALAAAAALMLEPVSRTLVGRGYEIRFRWISEAEIAAGLLLAAYVAVTASRPAAQPRR